MSISRGQHGFARSTRKQSANKTINRDASAERDRRVVDELMAGGRTKDVSQKFGMSPGRVSQLRRDFMEDWTRFTGEVA